MKTINDAECLEYIRNFYPVKEITVERICSYLMDKGFVAPEGGKIYTFHISERARELGLTLRTKPFSKKKYNKGAVTKPAVIEKIATLTTHEQAILEVLNSNLSTKTRKQILTTLIKG